MTALMMMILNMIIVIIMMVPKIMKNFNDSKHCKENSDNFFLMITIIITMTVIMITLLINIEIIITVMGMITLMTQNMYFNHLAQNHLE